MQIINFIKHQDQLLCQFGQFYETHSFDIEIPTPDGPIIWVGWSLRQHVKGKNLRLQGPMLYHVSTGHRYPAVRLKGKEEILPILIRQMLKEQFGIDIPPPTSRPPRNDANGPKIDQNQKDESLPKKVEDVPKNKAKSLKQ